MYDLTKYKCLDLSTLWAHTNPGVRDKLHCLFKSAVTSSFGDQHFCYFAVSANGSGYSQLLNATVIAQETQSEIASSQELINGRLPTYRLGIQNAAENLAHSPWQLD